MKEIWKKCFVTYPKAKKHTFTNLLLRKNFNNSMLFSKLILLVSFLMFLISVFENDLIILQYFNLFYFVASLIVVIMFSVIKLKENEVGRIHIALIYTFIFVNLIWSSSIFAFVPGRYELYGTHAMILLGIASFFYLRWEIMLSFILFSLVYIFSIISLGDNFFFVDPVIPKITVMLSLNILAMGISRIIYYKMLENFELNTSLLDQNEKIQVEVEKKTKAFKMANIKLASKEKQLELVMNSTGSGIYAVDENDICTYVNDITLKLLGYETEEELLGKNMHDLTHYAYEDGTNHPSKDCDILDAFHTGNIINKDDIIWRKDGTFIHVSYSSSPQIENGQIVGAVVTFKDISERKELQDNLMFEHQRTQQYLDIAGVMLMVLDRHANIQKINQKGCQILEDDEKEIVGKNWFDNYIPSDIKAKVKEVFRKTIQNKEDFDSQFENEIITATRKRKIINWNNSVLYDENNEFVGVISSGEDITDKKQIEDELINSQVLLKASLNSPKDIIILSLDKDYNYLYFNETHRNTMKNTYNAKIEVGKCIFDYISSEEDIRKSKLNYKKALEGQAHVTRESYGDIEIKTYETYYNPIYDYQENIIGVSAYARDISEIVEANKKLEKEKRTVQNYLDIAGVMLIVLNTQSDITMINQKGARMIGLNEDEIIGMNWFDNFIPKDDVKQIKGVFHDIFSGRSEVTSHYENPIINAKGEERYISWNNTILRDAKGNIIGLLASGEDITDKKRVEEELINSNERFQKLFEKAPIGYQSLDINGCFREVNQTWCDLLGYSKEEVIGKWFGDFLTPKYLKAFKERFELFKKLGKIHSEFEMIKKNGEILFIEFEGMIGYNDKHEFEQTYCTLNDNTKRMETLKKLEASESNLKLAQSIANIGSWELEINTNQIWGSEEAFKIYELDRTSEYLDYEIIRDMVSNEDREMLTQALKDLINDQKIYDETFKIVTRKDNVKYINSQAILMTDSDNKPVKVVGVIHDITEITNKQLELEYISQHDYLTDLYNRGYFVESYHKMDQSKYYPLGILMLDVNGLKIINDAYGHDIGDIALKRVSNVLQLSCREEDIVCRIGGDEFAVILPNVSEDELETIKAKIKETSKNEKVNNIELSIATGFEMKDETFEGNLDDILKLAENDMYKHKLVEGISVRNSAIKAILHTLTEKYEEEKIHSAKVSFFCKKIGEGLNFNEEDLKELEMAGMYHDIGKISIPDAILNKPGKLTKEEFETMKKHPEISYQILRAADEFSDLAEHALYHHERWDGTGYPSGKKAEDIPLFSRIISIADAYEAMTAVRCYKKKMSQNEAVKEIIRCAGLQFDERIARVFVEKVLHKTWET